jgi:2'-5' RNA ligase
MRLFVAVDVGDAVRQHAARIHEALVQVHGSVAARGLRWVEPSRLHLTVRFFGEVEDELAARLVSACSGALPLPPVDLGFGQPEWMPSASHPRVLMLPVVAGADALVAVKRAVDARLPADAPAEEDRAFRPHLTLTRVRPDWQSRVRARVELPREAPERRVSTRVEAVVLYESQLSPRGPDYRERGRLVLTGRTRT